MSKPVVLIEVRGGTVVFTAATNKDIDVIIVDHDGDETHKMDTPLDKVFNDKQMNRYIDKIMKEPGNQ